MSEEKIKDIWITGSSGQLGRCFERIAPEWSNFNFHSTTHDEVDITSAENINTFLDQHVVDLVINCAAYTDVDGAESEPELAHAVNASGVANLLEALPEDIPFIHFSTDYVFDGPLNRPLREDDPVSPASVYGQSKRAGEEILLNSHRRGYILRTSWLYSAFGHNFVKTMLRLASERAHLKVVSDQIGSPTHALDLARLTLQLVQEHRAQSEVGTLILHYSNSGVASWYDFAQTIFEYSQHQIEVEPVLSEAFPRPAPRPSYSVLDCSRVRNMTSGIAPWWKDSLFECLALIRRNESKLFPEDN